MGTATAAGQAGNGASRRIEALDGLRGFAALAVLVHHLHLPVGFARGYLAVDFFFLLSGYVIAHAYEARLAGGLGIFAYMKQRIERLYPMIFLSGLLGLLVWPYMEADGYFFPKGPIEPLLAIACQLLMIPFLLSSTQYPFNVALWSILFELGINFIHALLRPWLRSWLLALIVIGCGGWLIRIASEHWQVNFGWGIDNYWLGFPRVGFGFFLGILLYRHEHLWLRFVPRLPFLVIGVVLMALLGLPETKGPIFWETYRDPIVIAAMPFLLMLGRTSFGSVRLSTALGSLSYPLYALHGPMLVVAYAVGAHLGLLSGPWAIPAMISGGLAVVGLCWLAALFIEEPLNRMRHAARRRRRDRQIALAGGT